jgi:hypothetical protein
MEIYRKWEVHCVANKGTRKPTVLEGRGEMGCKNREDCIVSQP